MVICWEAADLCNAAVQSVTEVIEVVGVEIEDGLVLVEIKQSFAVGELFDALL